MDPKLRRIATGSCLTLMMIVIVAAIHGEGPDFVPNGALFPNPGGTSRTFSTTGAVDLTGPFFQSLGTNGRTCGSCHQPGDGMSVSAANGLKELETENAWLKKLLAESLLENEVARETLRKKW